MEAWSKIATEHADQGFAIFDKNLTLVYFNRRFLELYRLPPDMVFVGAAFKDLAHFVALRDYPQNADAITQERVDRAKEPELRRFEQTLDDGAVLDMRTIPLPDGGFLTTYTEITGLKNAIDEAQEANRSKSNFLANMSHELRTPLNAIIGFSEMLMLGTGIDDDDAKVKEYAGNIQQGGKILLETIDELLDFAKIESGRAAINLEDINLHDMARLCLGIVQQMPGAKNIRLRNNIPRDLPAMTFDQVGIRQIFLNLLSNAVKATGDGGAVTISAEVVGRGTVVISVSDTGQGIPKHLIPMLFEPFAGNSETYAREQKGTGLGLSIVRQQAERHGGSISVESVVGRGTVFRVSLPKDLIASPDQTRQA